MTVRRSLARGKGIKGTVDGVTADPLALADVDRATQRVIAAAGGDPTVSGPAYALASWLAGRSTGDGLTVDPPGPLPTIPDWI
jgi:maleylpyruvate isomerase